MPFDFCGEIGYNKNIVTGQVLNSYECKIHENRLYRWDFALPNHVHTELDIQWMSV